MEGVTGKDGLLQGTLKFTDEGGVEDPRSDEFHQCKEIVLVIGEFLLQGGEFCTPVTDIVRGEFGDLLDEQQSSLFEEAVSLYRIAEMHFYGLHLFPFLGA